MKSEQPNKIQKWFYKEHHVFFYYRGFEFKLTVVKSIDTIYLRKQGKVVEILDTVFSVWWFDKNNECLTGFANFDTEKAALDYMKNYLMEITDTYLSGKKVEDNLMERAFGKKV